MKTISKKEYNLKFKGRGTGTSTRKSEPMYLSPWFLLSGMLVVASSVIGCHSVGAASSSNALDRYGLLKGCDASPKLLTGNGNPLLDFMYVADPTAIVHDGRIYVYGTNDQQQIDSVGRENKNSYEFIHSLVMMSTDDMVNWTYHGIINVEKSAPWTGVKGVSWAPSIVSRVEDDGLTHFYMYYSHGGGGVAVLTSTSPVGPWTDPLGHNLIDLSTPGLTDCPAPFDPGAVIDDEGNGWLSFGGGKSSTATTLYPGSARIVRLGKDLLSLDSEISEIPAPYFFEASELNCINGTWVYSYSTDWVDRNEWFTTEAERPTICSISYMTSDNPLDKNSWKFRGDILKNPFGYGMSYTLIPQHYNLTLFINS